MYCTYVWAPGLFEPQIFKRTVSALGANTQKEKGEKGRNATRETPLVEQSCCLRRGSAGVGVQRRRGCPDIANRDREAKDRIFAGMKDPRQGREESASKPKRAVMVSGSMLCCCVRSVIDQQRRRRQDELHALKSADSKQPLLYYSTNTILQVTTALPRNRRPRLNWAADS
ncbi:hypothetical protein BDFG_04441 [Blastomyces dermatitidis ATCC 26199]|nr:hypothetical protein BDFG_04441 [Blastomyces dermatitidis ATCC 26199]